jgi:hypothetical protein
VSGPRLIALLVAALLLLAAGLWLARDGTRREDAAGKLVFAELKPAINEVTEIRIKKGDGAAVTLRRGDAGWTVAERGYTADAGRIRKLLLDVADLKSLEEKTREAANYAKLGVEDATSPTAGSTLLEIAGPKATWSLLVGKQDTPRSGFVRVASQPVSLLASPLITLDVDPKSWLDRQVLDIAAKQVQSVAITPVSGPNYTVKRERNDQPNLALVDIPAGAAVASPAAPNGAADALVALTFTDVRKASGTAATVKADYQLFDGKAFSLAGFREGDRAFIAASGAADLTQRLAGWEFEIPTWKFVQIFKPRADLLQP